MASARAQMANGSISTCLAESVQKEVLQSFSLMTRRKNWRTPMVALVRFLVSLMPLVSIK
jgi:hypothetical protein